MQSNNPIFRRSEEFNRSGGNPYGGTAMTDPSQWSVGTPGGTGYAPPATAAPMTIDSVVQKTAYEMLRSLVGSEMCIRDRNSSDRLKIGLLLCMVSSLEAGVRGPSYGPFVRFNAGPPSGVPAVAVDSLKCLG